MAAKTPNKINGTENAPMMERPSQPTPEVTEAAMAPENTISEIETLKQRIIELELKAQDLEAENEHLADQIHLHKTCQFEPMTSTLETTSLRTTMLLAMLPQVRIEHAHHDAQRADKAIDDIMKVWGLE